MKVQAGLIFGIMFLLLGCADQPEKLIMPDDIDISVTDTGIVSIPSDVDPILISIFSRYSKIIASNGKPIHIFAQSEVSDQQIIKARDILEFYLTDVPKSIYGRNKSVVANSMANRSASLLFFNNESSRKYAFEEFSLADLNLASQNLHATEFFVEGSMGYVTDQDIGMAIGQQKGVKSRGFDDAILTGQETRVRRYHEVLNDYIEGRR